MGTNTIGELLSRASALLFAVAVVAHGRHSPMVRSSSVRVVSRTRSRERDCALGPDRRDAGGPDRVARGLLARRSVDSHRPLNDGLRLPRSRTSCVTPGSPHSSTRMGAVQRERRGWPLGLQLFSCIAPIAKRAVVTRSSSALLGHRPPWHESAETSPSWYSSGTTGFPKGR